MFLPVVQLAKLLADGTITPQQLAAAFKDRLQHYDGSLHTVVTATDSLAAEQAAAAQEALTRSSNGSNGSNGSNRSRGASLLTGVPYGLKDLFAAPRYPTSWGLWALRNRTIDTVRHTARTYRLSAAGISKTWVCFQSFKAGQMLLAAAASLAHKGQGAMPLLVHIHVSQRCSFLASHAAMFSRVVGVDT